MFKLMAKWLKALKARAFPVHTSYRAHVQLEYVNAAGDPVESLVGVPAEGHWVYDFLHEWQEAIKVDPEARLVLGGRCWCKDVPHTKEG